MTARIDYRFRSVELKTATVVAENPTLAIVKRHLVVSDANSDTIIGDLTTRAIAACEQYLNRALWTSTWTAWADSFPLGNLKAPEWEGVRQGHLDTELRQGGERWIRLPKGVLQSVTHVKTYDDEDNATTFAASNYYVDEGTDQEQGRIVLRSGSTWPTVARVANGVEVEFISGWTDAGVSVVPPTIIQGILVHIESMWHKRGKGETPDVTVSRSWYDPYRFARDLI